MWWQPTPLIGGPYKYLVRPDADEAKDGETDEDDYVVLVSEIEPDEDDKFGSEAETDAELEAEKPESAAYRVPVRPQFQPDPPIGQTAVQKEPARVEG